MPWKDGRSEVNPMYFWFAVADILRWLAVYVEEVSGYHTFKLVKEIVNLICEIAKWREEANFDEEVWVPTYECLQEFEKQDPYDDLLWANKLEELRDRLRELVKEAKVKAKEIIERQKEFERQAREYAEQVNWDDLPF